MGCWACFGVHSFSKMGRWVAMVPVVFQRSCTLLLSYSNACCHACSGKLHIIVCAAGYQKDLRTLRHSLAGRLEGVMLTLVSRSTRSSGTVAFQSKLFQEPVSPGL